MCDFLSWIEKDDKHYFLTGKDLKSKRGRELRQHCGNDDDLIGHGAIRWFYGEFEGGINRECTDFTHPTNFPSDIAKAIKAGEFAGFGTPMELLNPSAYAAYRKIKQSALAEHRKIQQPAWAEYRKIEQSAFWGLFANPSNRPDAWKDETK